MRGKIYFDSLSDAIERNKSKLALTKKKLEEVG